MIDMEPDRGRDGCLLALGCSFLFWGAVVLGFLAWTWGWL
jgi:hypothetical protein